LGWPIFICSGDNWWRLKGVVCLEYANKAESNKIFKQNGLKSFRPWGHAEKNSMISGIGI